MYLTASLTRQDVTDALDRASINEEESLIRPAYGHGFNATCAAVVIPPGALAPFLTALALTLADEDRHEEAMDLADRVRTDAMGKDLIVYWPDVNFTA
jgi:hypothetical protein